MKSRSPKAITYLLYYNYLNFSNYVELFTAGVCLAKAGREVEGTINLI